MALSFLSRILNSVSYRFFPSSMTLRGAYYAYIINQPEPELLYLEKLLAGRRTAIDVGANVGYWTYKLRGLFEQVISVEMNEDCYRHIENAKFANVKLLKHGLSDSEKNVPFFIPVHNSGFVSHGWGTVEASRKTELFGNTLERTYLVKPLDSYGFKQVDFMKIDVEGHELAVIDGALETIKANRPLLIIEASAATLAGLNDRLGPLGYRQYIMADLIGIAGSEGNYIFAP